ncbi:uncharacterized protein EI97DRAFT_442212 [Westerdykella ornata]|uniref:Uncharacterized protein n=1 Tax=Westerdykella ornata TaxID=318751 RepID=A0A6A6JJS8_WESOR|nr:uncharacterized protein EI97DRAFT_442212 [Westerdykella ornata]KAF2276851.1 hypothetical protein EI97DRAFT_442212 [Westerdykella ornata]
MHGGHLHYPYSVGAPLGYSARRHVGFLEMPLEPARRLAKAIEVLRTSLNYEFQNQRLGSSEYSKEGCGKLVEGFAVKDVVSNTDIVNVYVSCLGEYAISHDEIWTLIHDEENIDGAPYGKTFHDRMYNLTLGKTCHCYKHMGRCLRPNGPSGRCSADDGHSLFNFLEGAMRLLTLVDLEHLEYATPDANDLTQSFEVFSKSTLGRVYHGQAVRNAVARLPRGDDPTKPWETLTWDFLLQGIAWLLGGRPSGIITTWGNSIGTARVFINGVAIVGSFCFNMTMLPRDARIHLSFGKTFYAGSQMSRLE